METGEIPINEICAWLDTQPAEEALVVASILRDHRALMEDNDRVWVEVWKSETNLIDSIRTQLEWHEHDTIRRTLAWLNDYFTEEAE